MTVLSALGSAPFNASFTGHATGSPAATEITFSWDFGDGSTPTVAVVPVTGGNPGTSATNHNFTSAGQFTVTLSVTDNAGDGPNATSLVIQVAPTLVASAVADPPVQDVGHAVVISAGGSGGWPPYRASWTSVPANCVAGTFNLTCTPPTPGLYSVRLTILDSAQDRATTQVNFTMSPRLVAQTATKSSYLCSGSTGVLVYNFTVVPVGGTSPYIAQWTFGDGSENSTGLQVEHQYGLNQTYVVSVRLSDGTGNSIVSSFSISTGFPSCQTQSAATYLPPTWILVASVGVAAVVVAVLALVFWRERGPSRPPRPPWSEEEPETPPSGPPAHVETPPERPA